MHADKDHQAHQVTLDDQVLMVRTVRMDTMVLRVLLGSTLLRRRDRIRHVRNALSLDQEPRDYPDRREIVEIMGEIKTSEGYWSNYAEPKDNVVTKVHRVAMDQRAWLVIVVRMGPRVSRDQTVTLVVC